MLKKQDNAYIASPGHTVAEESVCFKPRVLNRENAGLHRPDISTFCKKREGRRVQRHKDSGEETRVVQINKKMKGNPHTCGRRADGDGDLILPVEHLQPNH
jgi:hypothetical protein